MRRDLCMHVLQDLDFSEISDKVLTDSAIEQVWCEVNLRNERILIVCVYILNAENIAMFNFLTKADRLMKKGTVANL